jgi:membrane protein DedA with SNARE-associated domain
MIPHFVPGQPLGLWVYVVIYFMAILEGPIVTLLSAVAASAGYLKPQFVFLAAASGNLSADCLWYLLGYLGKIEWIIKIGRFVGIRPEQVLDLQTEIKQNVLKILFIAKLTLGFVIPTLIAIGLSHVPIRRWIGVLASAECIWSGSLVVLGYFFGRYLNTLERGIQWFALGGVLLFVVLILNYGSKRRAQVEERY